MNEIRKKIIMQEIKYWKQSKLLPEQYCDFLLTLYSGGEERIEPVKKKSSVSLHIPLWIFTTIFFSILFVNYFTEIPIGLQITLTAIAIIIFGFFMVRYIKEALLFQLAMVCLALLILMESVNLADFIFPNNNGILYIILLVQCGIWCMVGHKLKLLYFLIAGIVGAVIIVYFLAKSWIPM
jgi:hypothetical protein